MDFLALKYGAKRQNYLSTTNNEDVMGIIKLHGGHLGRHLKN